MIAHGVQPSSGSDKTYEHHQLTAASTWLIIHNLNKHPNVQVFDSAGNEWMGEIIHDSLNQLRISFMAGAVPASFGGIAYLN